MRAKEITVKVGREGKEQMTQERNEGKDTKGKRERRGN